MTHESVVVEQYRSFSGCTSHIDPTKKSYHKIIQPLYEKCFTDEELKYLLQKCIKLYT